MLTFLAPSALVGLLLLAVPVLVHIFKPRKMKQTPFSSLRWLRQTQQRLSRRLQWHQLLLFLLRAGFIVLLVLALAEPLIGTQGAARHTDRYVVVDVSRSMAYQAAGRPTPLEKAKQVAADLVRQGRAGDRTALLLTGSGTRLVTGLVTNPEAHLTQVDAAAAGATDTSLSSALAVVRPLLARPRADTDAELYFLTDNHQGSWNQGEVAAFQKDLTVPVRVRLVDVGVPGAQNGWVSGARLLIFGEQGRRVLRVEVRCIGDARQERSVRVAGLAGQPEQTQPVGVEPGAVTLVDFEVAPGYDLRGQVAHISLEPPDALPSDDHYYLNLDTPAALRVLLVEPESDAKRQPAGLHFRTAVEALASKTNQAIDVSKRTSAAAAAKDVAEADVIVLAGVPELPAETLQALEKRVQAGAGLVVFLGDGVRPEFYNGKLFKPLQPAEGLLPVRLEAPVKREGGESLAALTGIRWSHRLLAPLHDPSLGELAQARFGAYYRFAGSPGDDDTVLAWYDDSVPAVIEHAAGAGKVLLFNTSADDAWGDLPRRKSYVPLVDRVLNYLSGGGVRRNFEVGDLVALPLADGQPGEKVQVVAPGGSRLTPSLTSAGGRALLRLDNVTEPGVYQVERGAASARGFAFVVNAGRGDSVLTPMDTAALAKWWEPLSLEVLTPEAATRGAAKGGPVVLWPWLVGLAAGLLLLEMFCVHWLCPKANPTLAEVVVHRRGLLKPLTSGQTETPA